VTAAFRCRFRDLPAFSGKDILADLVENAARSPFATHYHKQTDAWQFEIQFLRQFAQRCADEIPSAANWSLLLEFEIPRRGKRPDVVLLADDVIFILEFKVGTDQFGGGGPWQVLSYALDLRDFHRASQGRTIVPILVATHAAESDVSATQKCCDSEFVRPVIKIADLHGDRAAEFVCREYRRRHDPEASPIDPTDWEDASYRPTPTIIEAAQTLFSGHSVSDISHAFATNLDKTSQQLIAAIEAAQAQRERVICFVTGLPGAGKTLAGLNAVHDPSIRQQGRPAGVFLSGNGPLVKIVREALIRDRQRNGHGRDDSQRTVATFIDNVHRFIDTYGIKRPNDAPYENAVVFDEAQRAWNAAEVARQHAIERSEPDLVLDIMERAPEWSAIIALVGGGQEIHRGEAGLEEWGRALNARTKSWKVLASPEVLKRGEAVAGHCLFETSPAAHLAVAPSEFLHLQSCVRSPRARALGTWVNALLFQRSPRFTERAASDIEPPNAEFPIVLTRELHTAREWLKQNADGSQRAGLLASSGALRLRHHGIEVSTGFRQGYSFEDWFLSDSSDCRSSIWLEVAATEFECQGLELDWAGVCWGGDVAISPQTGAWLCRKFVGKKWQFVRKPQDVRYALNKYRVLLTRARSGMVIWVPRGDSDDPTREPDLLNATAEYLQSRGIPLI
jgi:hypothetical protein